MEEAVLEAMLTQRVVTTRGEVFTKQLSVQDASFTRDAIVKSLYEVRCFTTIYCHHFVLLEILDFTQGYVSTIVSKQAQRSQIYASSGIFRHEKHVQPPATVSGMSCNGTVVVNHL